MELFSAIGPSRNRHGNHSPSCRRDLLLPTQEGAEDSGIKLIAARLAHLGTLHWRVWGALAYINGGVDIMAI